MTTYEKKQIEENLDVYDDEKINVRIPLFSAVLPLFPAKLTIFFRKPECAHFGPFIFRRGLYNSAVEGAMTRPVHVRFFWGLRFSTRCTT